MNNAGEIEARSMEIIEGLVPPGERAGLSEEEWLVARRVIHATGDPGFLRILRFAARPVEAWMEAVRRKAPVLLDTGMAKIGVSEKALSALGIEAAAFVGAEEAARLAEAEGITRSAAGMRLGVERLGRELVAVVGNAPTALFELLRLWEEGAARPLLVLGFPVGFVGAREAKERLRECPIPSVSTVGTRGGTAAAVAALNALLQLALEGRDG